MHACFAFSLVTILVPMILDKNVEQSLPWFSTLKPLLVYLRAYLKFPGAFLGTAQAFQGSRELLERFLVIDVCLQKSKTSNKTI